MLLLLLLLLLLSLLLLYYRKHDLFENWTKENLEIIAHEAQIKEVCSNITHRDSEKRRKVMLEPFIRET